MDDVLGIFAGAGDGAWAVGLDQRILFWNPAAEKMLGLGAQEVLGKRCWHLLAGRDLQGKPVCCNQCPVLAQARQGSPVSNFDLVVRCENGRQALINVSTLFVSREGRAVAEKPDYLVHLFRLLDDAYKLPSGLRIHLLGPTTVARADGSLVQGPMWQRAKVRALLAILAVHRGQPRSRQFLVETFWPDLEYSSACRNLNTTIYYLRRCLEPGLPQAAASQYICRENNHYVLPGHMARWLDVEAFEDSVYRARREVDEERAIAHYRRATAYYRGDFQSDLEPEWPWHKAEQTRLRDMYLVSLEELGLLHERLQQAEEASALYLRVLKLDSCHERACRRLMRLSLRCGERRLAQTHFHRLARALAEELKILPSEETRQLYELARRGD